MNELNKNSLTMFFCIKKMPWVVIGILLTLAVALPVSAKEVEVGSKKFDKAVENAILNNPSIIEKAMKKLGQQRQQKLLDNRDKYLKSGLKEVLAVDNNPILGNKKGKIVVVAFMDYLCDHCRELNKVVKKVLADNKNIKYVLKGLPFINSSGELLIIMTAAYSIDAKKYTKLLDSIFADSANLSKEKIVKYLKAAGYKPEDVIKLAENKDSKVVDTIRKNITIAQKLAINSVPTLVIGGELYHGALSKIELEAAIEKK